LRLEELETRDLLSGLTPFQVRHAYGFDQAVFSVDGQAIQGDGTGQTIAIIAAYDHPTIFEDLDRFDQTFSINGSQSLYDQYGPASAVLTKATPQGQPETNADWALEIALDVQWAHAIAPGAKVLLVEARSARLDDLMTAVDYARQQPGVTVVSMSWTVPEIFEQTAYDAFFTTPPGHAGVTFVAASGDDGAPATWPAASPFVLAVGGTTLLTDEAGNHLGETGWAGSGGGASRFSVRPGYQGGLVPGAGQRTSPDVSFHADPNLGFAVYNSVPRFGQSGWIDVAGTSAGAPQWAALVAIVNQGRALDGKVSLDGFRQTLPALYAAPASAFHDVTEGENGHFAAVGYDLVTGRGSPYADRVIRYLLAVADLVTPKPTPQPIPGIGGPAPPEIPAPAAPQPPLGSLLAGILLRDSAPTASQVFAPATRVAAPTGSTAARDFPRPRRAVEVRVESGGGDNAALPASEVQADGMPEETPAQTSPPRPRPDDATGSEAIAPAEGAVDPGRNGLWWQEPCAPWILEESGGTLPGARSNGPPPAPARNSSPPPALGPLLGLAAVLMGTIPAPLGTPSRFTASLRQARPPRTPEARGPRSRDLSGGQSEWR
jgi:hypothetical protein